ARRAHGLRLRRDRGGDVRAPGGDGRDADRPRRAARQVRHTARAGARRHRGTPVRRAEDLARFAWLLRRYLAPHWPAVAVLLLGTALSTVLAAAFPVLMAPILDLALGGSGTAPTRLSGLTLGNLGAAFFAWIGVGGVDDRFRAIVLLCLAYVAIG